MPLALDARKRLDERRQRALVRYYHAAGSGGLAVGVHTTQFEIREPRFNLFRPVLALASETLDACSKKTNRPFFKIAGACGPTRQAAAEAAYARSQGYQACLLSLAALKGRSVEALAAHCGEVARTMPLVGFYLQAAVGGPELPYGFWRRFFEIKNVVGVKIAPFNRYQTMEVLRALADSGREQEIALYTGNDDSIVADLLTPFRFAVGKKTKTLRIRGGLLGHWAVWTRRAVDLLEEVHELGDETQVPARLLRKGAEVTDCNAAFFDAAHGFKGCIAGLHYVLKRQGLMKNLVCLSPKEKMSPGQAGEIERVYRQYPHLNDDAFVKANLGSWLR
jgi:hypothetical protein